MVAVLKFGGFESDGGESVSKYIGWLVLGGGVMDFPGGSSLVSRAFESDVAGEAWEGIDCLAFLGCGGRGWCDGSSWRRHLDFEFQLLMGNWLLA